MLRLLLTGKLLFFLGTCYSQNVLENGAQEAAFSHAVTAQKGLHSFLYNPGAFLINNQFAFGSSYSNWLGVRGFDNLCVVARYPHKRVLFSLAVQEQGWEHFRLLRTSMGIAYALSNKINAGISGSNFAMDFGGRYGRYSITTANIGIQYLYTEKIHFGVSVFNLKKNRPPGFSPSSIESLLRVGCVTQLQKQLKVHADICAQPTLGTYVSVACAYDIRSNFQLQLGLRTLNKSLSFGFSYRKNSWRLSVASQTIQRLGWVTHIGIARE